MRKRPLLLCACVFLAGLLYGKYKSVELIVVLAVWLCYEFFCGIRRIRIKLAAGRSVLLLSAFILGNMHMQMELSFRDAYLSKMKDGKEVAVWGEITKIETTSTGKPRLILSECFVSLEEGAIPCNDVMVYPSSNQYQVGEIHKITGQLNLFEKARNEGGFDSRSFYQSQKIDFCIYSKESQLLERNENEVKRGLLSLKKVLSEVYFANVSARTAGFLAGMLLGDRSGLEAELKQLFTSGGIVHILAISGLHVSMIGRGLYSRLRKWGISFGTAGLLAGTLLLMYCFMVGNGMSAVRAVCMMLIFFLGQMLGRSYDMLNALGAAVLLLLWDNPFLLEYSGFWFSVSALIGVGFVGTVFSMLFDKGKGLLMSIGITLTTLPVVAYCYYEIPLYSPVVNFLLLPLLTPIFVLALAGGFVGVYCSWPAAILLLPCQWGLRIYEWVCQFVAKLPFAMVITGSPSLEMIIAYYMLLFSGTVVLHRMICHRLSQEDKEKRRNEWLLALTMTGVCFCVLIFPKVHEEEITFLDVGQGDGIYISTGDDIQYFIDGGSSDEKNLGQYCILPFLKSKGIRKIDYWFVSHVDTDHVSGLLEVMESGYKIGHLVVSAAAKKDDPMQELLVVAKQQGIDIIYMETGDCLTTEGTTITCMYPSIEVVEEHPKLLEDRNESSLVLEFVSKNFSEESVFCAIFAGDISSEVEEILLQEGCLRDVDLYKVTHHGSRYSSGEAFLAAILPEYGVVSCGRNNRYGHPHEETLERLKDVECEIRCTSEGGQVTFWIKEEEVWIQEYLRKD